MINNNNVNDYPLCLSCPVRRRTRVFGYGIKFHNSNRTRMVRALTTILTRRCNISVIIIIHTHTYNVCSIHKRAKMNNKITCSFDNNIRQFSIKFSRRTRRRRTNIVKLIDKFKPSSVRRPNFAFYLISIIIYR